MSGACHGSKSSCSRQRVWCTAIFFSCFEKLSYVNLASNREYNQDDIIMNYCV